MLHWRVALGVLLIAVLAALCWLDHAVGLPGTWLMPLAVLLSLLASGEIVRLCKSAGLKPLGPLVCCGNLLLVLSAWTPTLWQHFHHQPAGDAAGQLSSPADCWPLLPLLGVLVLLAFMGEMFRYEGGKAAAIGNLGATTLSLVYVGLMLSVLVQLRLTYGVAALVALVIVVKMGDTGAYTVGRLIGRHKMAPRLSPGKTIEGAFGSVVFSLLGSWFSFTFLVPWLGGGTEPAAASASQPAWWGWVLFGIVVGISGLLGDLAESLLKRDANCKDSSGWLPGFGGVLDLLDSVLLAGPAAYLFWALGLVNCG